MSGREMTRRQFGRSVAGLVVTFSLAPDLIDAAGDGLPGNLDAAPQLAGWLRIEVDGRVTVFTGKVELGQGILTALAQIAAEELDLPLRDIRIISGRTGVTPDEGYTTGSRSLEDGGTALRYACAEARAVLLDEAAARLDVPVAQLRTGNGTIFTVDGRKLTYAEIAAGDPANQSPTRALNRPATGRVAPKPAATRTIVGTSAPRLDIPNKMTGGPAFVQDLRLPGMVFGRVVRPPGPGAGLENVDIDRVRALPGVLAVVRDGDFLGVVAEREEQAIKARDVLAGVAGWSASAPLPEAGRIYEWLRTRPADRAVVAEKSDPAAAPVVKRLEATFTKPYLAHASLGPSCAVAEMRTGRLHVRSHTQGVYPLRNSLAEVLRLDPEAVVVEHVEGAGCYGHNGADDAALDAALLARALPGRPVKVQWMRDDECAWEPFGSAMVMQLSAGLGADGAIVDWRHEVWSNAHSSRPGRSGRVNLLAAWHLAEPAPPYLARSGGEDRNAVPLYEIPNLTVVRHLVREMPLRTSALRTLGAYANVFALESFMDELALAAGADPVDFRLRHLRDPRGRAVIETAATESGWRPGLKSDGTRGRGFGFARYKNLACYVACVAEVEVDRSTGRVRVRRVVAVAEAGQTVNPNGLAMQIEGGIVQAASWTLKEAVAFDRSRVTSRDWASYPILAFPDVPKVEVHLLNRPEEKFLGSGEASSGPAAAAIANAVGHALGRRCRDLPLLPERLRQAAG